MGFRGLSLRDPSILPEGTQQGSSRRHSGQVPPSPAPCCTMSGSLSSVHRPRVPKPHLHHGLASVVRVMRSPEEARGPR